MLRSRLYPTRTTVGPAIPIGNVQVIDQSPAASAVDVTIELRDQPFAIISDPAYVGLVPQQVFLGATPSAPAFGVAALPVPLPPDLPFDPDVPFCSIFGLGNHAITADVARQIWFDLRVDLATKSEVTIGGICYGGYPYLPYYVNEDGENSSNFGLPRSLRLSWESTENGGFVDADGSVSSEEPTSHSGVHLLATGPVRATSFVLRVSSLPRLLVGVLPQSGAGPTYRMVETWGFALPFLYVFSHLEQTRYRPAVPAGLLAAVHHPPHLAGGYFAPAAPPPSPPAPPVPAPAALAGASADTLVRTGGVYFPFSAGSLFGHRRTFVVGDGPNAQHVHEAFVSAPLSAGQHVRIYVEQAEEEERCIAAVRLQFPELVFEKAFPEPPSALRMRLEIYELDPAEGVSPLALHRDPKTDRYATRLYEKVVVPAPDGVTCRLARPSRSRYFALVFTCPEGVTSPVMLREIALVQSAHVEVRQRASRNQVVHGLAFRLFGADLTTDYARLGAGGFGFAVEHVVGGDRKQLLFEANSLLDLLQLSTVRVNANRRFNETTHLEMTDQADTQAGSFDVRRTYARADGWNRTKTGDGVTWTASSPIVPGAAPTGANEYGFVAFSNSETRTQSRLLGPQAASGVVLFSELLTSLKGLLQPHGITLPGLDAPAVLDLMAGAVNGVPWSAGPGGGIWRGTLVANDANVDGLTIYAVPPIISAIADLLTALTNNINDLNAANIHIRSAGSPSSPPSAATTDTLLNSLRDISTNLLQALLAASPMGVINGIGMSIGAGGGIGYNGGVSAVANLTVNPSASFNEGLSMNCQLPTMTHNFTVGTTGTNAKQASATGFSYAQSLAARFDQTQAHTLYDQGTMKRSVVQDFLLDPDHRRQVRSKSPEIMWQGDYIDIITGTIPLNLQLRGTAGNAYRTTDEAVRVHFLNGVPDDVRMDVSFDVSEEVIRDDH